MKKITLLIVTVIGLISCDNWEFREYSIHPELQPWVDDYDSIAVLYNGKRFHDNLIVKWASEEEIVKRTKGTRGLACADKYGQRVIRVNRDWYDSLMNKTAVYLDSKAKHLIVQKVIIHEMGHLSGKEHVGCEAGVDIMSGCGKGIFDYALYEEQRTKMLLKFFGY